MRTLMGALPHMRTNATVHPERPEDNSPQSGSLLPLCGGLGDRTQVARLGSWCPYLLSHLTGRKVSILDPILEQMGNERVGLSLSLPSLLHPPYQAPRREPGLCRHLPSLIPACKGLAGFYSVCDLVKRLLKLGSFFSKWIRLPDMKAEALEGESLVLH